MKKATTFLICILYLLALSGCGLVYMDDSKGKKAYNDAITAIFNALDEKDNEAIYNLFSPSVRKKDEDLEDQIDRLLSIYEGPTDEIGWDGLLGSEASYHSGKHRKNVFARFPIRSGDTYYWCYMNLMYENTFDEQQIGIVQMDFYTADEYCILEYDENLKIVNSVGLTVHADATIDNEIRCISGHPHMYSTSTEPLNIGYIRNFFKTSNSFSEFKEQFGSPNAENIWCYYELPIESGENRYLQIGTDNDTIYGATVVNEFEYIETIYDENDQIHKLISRIIKEPSCMCSLAFLLALLVQFVAAVGGAGDGLAVVGSHSIH